MRQLLVCLALLVCSQSRGGAQSVRGTVSDQSGSAIPGVVVLLVDHEGRTVARALTNERGEYQLAAGNAGLYRVRTMRIGFRPLSSTPIALRTGIEDTHAVVVTSQPFILDTVRASGRSACLPVSSDSSSTAFELWEQVRAALIATDLTARARTIVATTVGYDRTFGPRQTRVGHQVSDVRTDFVQQPWRSRAPDSLRKFGYILSDQSGQRTDVPQRIGQIDAKICRRTASPDADDRRRAS